jgi:hypothetical protein
MRGEDHIFLKNGRDIFFAGGLDRASDYQKLFARRRGRYCSMV